MVSVSLEVVPVSICGLMQLDYKKNVYMEMVTMIVLVLPAIDNNLLQHNYFCESVILTQTHSTLMIDCGMVSSVE